MRRFILLVLLLTAAFVAGLLFGMSATPRPANAADTLAHRVAVLQERVDDLEARVDDLEAR